MKVQLLLISVLLGAAAGQNVPSVPGLASWRAALDAHARAEGFLTGSTTPPPFNSAIVPGLPQWHAHQATVLAAEKRLDEQVNFLEGRITTSSPESTNTPSSSTSAASQSSISTLSSFLSSLSPSSSTAPSSPSSSSAANLSTTESSSPIKSGFDNILKSSLTKFIEQIETVKKDIPERSSVKKILDSHNFDKNDRSDTFLDKLLNSFQDDTNSILDNEDISEKKESRRPIQLPNEFTDLGFEDKLESELEDFISILQQIEGFEDYNSVDDYELTEFDRSLQSGRVLGNFIQEELQEAAEESQQLSTELDELLKELEGEKEKDLRFLEETYKIINSKLKKGNTFRTLKKDKKFVNSVFHRFALLGHPLREEDISLKMLKDAKEIVTRNVLAAAEQSRNIALDIKSQLNGEIRRSGRSGLTPSGLREVEQTLTTVLNLI